MGDAQQSTNAETAKVRVPVEDPVALEGFLAELLPESTAEARAVLVGLVSRQNKEITRLAAALSALRRGRSGGDSERIGREQMALFAQLAQLVQGATVSDPPADALASDAAGNSGSTASSEASAGPNGRKEKEKLKPRRRTLSERYPRLEIRDVLVKVEDRTCGWCGLDKVCIGHDTSEVLEYQPPTFYILHYLRERLACPEGCDPVAVAPAVDKVLDGGIPGPGLVADLVERKYVDQLSVSAVVQSWARGGTDIPESTVYGWATAMGRLAQPVADAIRHKAVVEAHVTGTDDTTVRILDRDAEKGRLIGHMWSCLGDGVYAAYFATKTWQAGEAWTFLKARRSGWLQGDGYGGYAPLVKVAGPALKLAGCWVHARRYFVKARDRGDRRAEPFLVLIGELFEVEAQATAEGVSHEIRLKRRLERSKPVLDRLVVQANAVVGQAVPKSPLGAALTYLRNQRPQLRQFLEDGRLPIENNGPERALRPIATGRKRWLFFGSFDGALAGANLFTVAATAKLSGVNVRSYLKWLFEQLGRREWTADQARHALLPEHFAALKQTEQ
jgi:transposase